MSHEHAPSHSPAPATGHGPPAAPEPLDLREKGATVKGVPQVSDRRLFMQLQVYTEVESADALVSELSTSGLESVLYLDMNDPRGVGVLFMSEDPSLFTGAVRHVLNTDPFVACHHRPEMTMIGRTYAIGREQDLEHWLLKKPRQTSLNPAWPWAVWYPLRRKGEFGVLSREELGKVLAEHGGIGAQFGDIDAAHDVRLACHGLDRDDNDFVIGLIGKDLFPLSACVQAMRKTQQTAKWIESLGPFFVGKAHWQSPMK